MAEEQQPVVWIAIAGARIPQRLGRPRQWLLVASALLSSPVCSAHVFTQPYTLPMPFSLYALGASAALVLSFVIMCLFAKVPLLRAAASSRMAVEDAGDHGIARSARLLAVGRALALGLLVLAIATGLFGTRNAFANFSMTFFWIVFVLAVPYAVALAGDFYAAVNPWRTLVGVLHRTGWAKFEPRITLPRLFGHVPALALYMAFIWLELFGQLQPRGLAWALLGYTLINVAGAWLLGSDAWFRQGEFFGVFLRLIGRMAPWCPAGEIGRSGRRNPRGHWRAPFIGLLDEPVQDIALVLFIVFMLSSTAFDGLHATLPFVTIFWKNIYPVIAPLFTAAPGQQYALSAQLYYVWQWTTLISSPFVYLAVFASFVALAQRLACRTGSVQELVLRFSVWLVPIAFAYHITHYYTVLLAQGGQIVKLVSDPFGWGWNLLGTARWNVRPFLVDVDTIWHTQIALIVIGHVAGAYLSHIDALRLFPRARHAVLSQLPLLGLMVLFTTMGLWILSLPLASR